MRASAVIRSLQGAAAASSEQGEDEASSVHLRRRVSIWGGDVSGLSWRWWTVSAGPGRTLPGWRGAAARRTLSVAKPSPEKKGRKKADVKHDKTQRANISL